MCYDYEEVLHFHNPYYTIYLIIIIQIHPDKGAAQDRVEVPLDQADFRADRGLLGEEVQDGLPGASEAHIVHPLAASAGPQQSRLQPEAHRIHR